MQYKYRNIKTKEEVTIFADSLDKSKDILSKEDDLKDYKLIYSERPVYNSK